MDVAGSLILIVLLSPLFLLTAVYIKAVSPGKAFFKQKRVGYRGKIFTFIKFRTMHQNNDPGVHREHLKDLIKSGRPMEKLDGGRDARIIPHGKVIRKLCLDELPQLFNVLRREMSLVGPRPCIPYEAEEYLRWHAHRFDTLPGMTGLWQVSGKNKLSFEKMIRLDISYALRMSPLFDLKILLLTGPAIIKMVFEASMKRMSVLTPSAVSMIEGGEKGSLRDA
jgi:lipopolysaccharide/colanic/teichoic acid biosynthesis glycosyltransferase